MRVAYAQQFGGIDNPSKLVSAQEVGDGNLNLVFKIFDIRGVSGLSLSRRCPRALRRILAADLDRARLEAKTLVVSLSQLPATHGAIVHFDPELAVMVMEDLSDHRIWRAG